MAWELCYGGQAGEGTSPRNWRRWLSLENCAFNYSSSNRNYKTRRLSYYISHWAYWVPYISYTTYLISVAKRQRRPYTHCRPIMRQQPFRPILPLRLHTMTLLHCDKPKFNLLRQSRHVTTRYLAHALLYRKKSYVPCRDQRDRRNTSATTSATSSSRRARQVRYAKIVCCLMGIKLWSP